MAGVYGRKVREPKVTARGTLPFSSRADSQAKGESVQASKFILQATSPFEIDLEQAWANFGEAKTVVSGWDESSTGYLSLDSENQLMTASYVCELHSPPTHNLCKSFHKPTVRGCRSFI